MGQKPTIIVVGLGAYGSAVLSHLAALGIPATGIDRYAPPHARGASHGDTRITRLAAMEGEEYMRAAGRSIELAQKLQRRTGRALFRRNGFLLAAGEDAGNIAAHGLTSVFDRTIGLAERFGIEHQVLSAAETRKRFPGYALSEGERAYYEPGSGTLYPEACIAACLEEARRDGASIKTNETVLEIGPTPSGGVRVKTDKGEYRSDMAVVTAGPWMKDFLPPAMADDVAVTRQVLYWFKHANPEAFSVRNHPNFAWLHPSDTGLFFGFPAQDGARNVKMATERYDLSVRPGEPLAPADEEEIAQMFNAHIKGRIVGVRPEIDEAKPCPYTTTASGKFIIAPNPDMPEVLLVSACSGHGFKTSAAIGEAIARRIANLPREHVDLDAFAPADI